jgi:hypothetical protein
LWLSGPTRFLPLTRLQHGRSANDERDPLTTWLQMHLTTVQDQAVTAHMALIVGSTTFDRLFAGVRFDELDGDLLYVYAKDEDCAAEMEDGFALHISIIASDILKRDVGIVLVLPKQLAL